MAKNECIPFYDEGDEITAQVDVAVSGKTFVKINNNIQSGPGLSGATVSGGGGNVRVAPATAAGRSFGVAAYDAPVGGKVTVLRAPGIVLPVVAGAAIAAFQEVEIGANAKAVPLAAGKAVGYALTAAAQDADAMIHIY